MILKFLKRNKFKGSIIHIDTEKMIADGLIDIDYAEDRKPEGWDDLTEEERAQF